MDYAGKFPELCQMIGQEQLAADPRYATLEAAQANEAELIGIFDDYFSRRTWAEVDAALTQLDIAHNRICHFADLAEDEQARANGYIYPIQGRGGRRDLVAATPIKFGANEAVEHKNAPLLGENTLEVLREYGYSEEEIQVFLDEHVVYAHE